MKRRSGASAAKSSTATATTGTADGSRGAGRGYVGRFAPSPSGDLHLGSLFTAAASYLDARANAGRWLLRMEDLDLPRVVPGAADGILRTLERFGFAWDGEVVLQSTRTGGYRAALDELRGRGLIFECSCSRSQLADEERYPGTCRDRPRISGTSTAIRVRVDPGAILFTDRIQGTYRQDPAVTVGDLIVRRRDQLFAYVIAVVVDDAAQGVTHVVRGADLLDNTPRQIYLQRLLGLPDVRYAHVPVLTEPDGRKLAKSARSVAVAHGPVAAQLVEVFDWLNLSPPPTLALEPLREVWNWAIGRWRIEGIRRRLSLPLKR